MSSTQDRSDPANDTAGHGTIDLKLEAIMIPVSDVDRAKDFYTSLGWRIDADVVTGEDVRLVQLTPPGSACSIQFGTNLTSAVPGSLEGTYLIVSDIEAARERLVASGVEAGEVFHEATLGDRFHPVTNGLSGPAPDHRSYGSFVSFKDPDGNGWLLQEITTRLPGRVERTATTFASVSDLSKALQRAEAAHGEHEARIGHADPAWPDWYAKYMVAAQAGEELPS